MEIEQLKGKIISAIEVEKDGGADQVCFATKGGPQYIMYHSQDCCESVWIDEIVGDLEDLIGSPVLEAEEVTNRDEDMPPPDGCYVDESWTWTFYKIGTINGHVNIRWFGTSNGYYSESVSFEERPS